MKNSSPNKDFLNAMALFPSGITVLTWGDYEKPSGVTVSAFSSLSLQPTLVLFCIKNNSYVLNDLLKQEKIVINFLSRGQTDIAYQFAGSNRDNLTDQLSQFSNLPALKNALVHLEAKIQNSIIQGDHHIFIAEIDRIATHPEKGAIVYFNRQITDL